MSALQPIGWSEEFKFFTDKELQVRACLSARSFDLKMQPNLDVNRCHRFVQNADMADRAADMIALRAVASIN